ncbi:MAG: DUF6118 family protein [Rhodoplanes sp.]
MAETPEPMQRQAEADPATLAFEALREEVALVRRAVAGLAAERASIEIPDYSETLGHIMRAFSATRESVKALAEMPALRLSAKDWSHEIATAAQEARRFDQQAFAEARHGFERMAAEMAAHLRSARSAERQRQWLIWTTAGGIVAGMLLLVIIVGPVVRAMPESWPERMAASILGTDEETAGVRLIKTASPDRWRDIVRFIAHRHAARHRRQPPTSRPSIGHLPPQRSAFPLGPAGCTRFIRRRYSRCTTISFRIHKTLRTTSDEASLGNS